MHANRQRKHRRNKTKDAASHPNLQDCIVRRGKVDGGATLFN
jgi:hypothetical protein